MIPRLTDEERRGLARARKALEDSRIVVNLNLHEPVLGRTILESLLDSKRVYNLFEIAHAAIGANPSRFNIRVMLEFKLYGATSDLQMVLGGMSNTERPSYGLLDYIRGPVGYSLVGTYGWYRFVLKRGVRLYTTFSPIDSFHIRTDQTFTWNDIDAVLTTKVSDRKRGERYWFEFVNAGIVPIDARGNPAYIEAQILGGVFIDRDVEMLYHPETDERNPDFYPKLVKLARLFDSRRKLRDRLRPY